MKSVENFFSHNMKPKVTIENIPEPIIEYILSYLSPYRDLRQCMLVNKAWSRYVSGVVRKMQRDFVHAVSHMSVEWSHVIAEAGPTIAKRYSHSACCIGNSMYIFGGCTTASTTFNDLWRLDLGTRCWIRPLATGTYPPPKACATLVSHNDNLILFGGWTHTAPYPLHQVLVFKVFNQVHVYNTITNRWMQITNATGCPPVAGHSATVHGDHMIIFGGVHKKSPDGPFANSNDVWALDLSDYKWYKQTVINEPPPSRYGQSQISIDNNHLLIMGGCGGPNKLFNDVWLLRMHGGPGGPWEWQELLVRERENSAPYLAFHPACKVGTQVVVMSKNRSWKSPFPNLLRAPPSRTWVPPRLTDNERNAKRPIEPEACVNGKRGVLKRAFHRKSAAAAAHPSSSTSSSEEDSSSDIRSTFSTLEVDMRASTSSSAAPSTSSSAVPSTSSAAVPSTSSAAPSTSSSTVPSTSSSAVPSTSSSAVPSTSSSAVPSADSDSKADSRPSIYHPHRSRQKRIEMLNIMEEKLRAMGNSTRNEEVRGAAKQRPPRRPMCLYVLDTSAVLEGGHVTWRTLKPPHPAAPEEIILYSLILGKGEVIMFGGIQKYNFSDDDGDIVPEVVSNNLHFMTGKRIVI